MRKLDEIKLLVEETYVKIHYAALPSTKKEILTSFARKCAEINVDDWDLCSRTCVNTIEGYNSHLRDGQVETPESQPAKIADMFNGNSAKDIWSEIPKHFGTRPALQPLPEKMPEWFIEALSNPLTDRSKVWEKIRQHFGTQQSNLQPLPYEVPDWFITSWKNTSGDITMRIEEWHKIVDHFGTQPESRPCMEEEMPLFMFAHERKKLSSLELWIAICQHFGSKWWHRLKKGDKFQDEQGNTHTFSGTFFLETTTPGHIRFADKCTPYTDPRAKLLESLNEDQQKLFELYENSKK